MSYSLEEINRRVADDPQHFVEECEALAHSRIEEATERIIANLSKSPVVLLSGPSGSGKTTTARKIETELERRGVNTHAVSMDDYFKTLMPDTAPRTETGEIDFESPKCLDMDLLNEHFAKLAAGEPIRIPHFMFVRQKRSASQFTDMHLQPNEIAIFEGIHAFNDDITDKNPDAFKLYISVDSRIQKDGEDYFRRRWQRLLRRTVRDDKFRGASAESTLKMWPNVVKNETENILRHARKADFRVDSSLAFEVPLLKNFALPLFEALPHGREIIPEFDEIVERLRSFASLDEKYVAPESLLREFIGGGIYNY